MKVKTRKQGLLEALKSLNHNSSELERQEFIEKLNDSIDTNSQEWIKLVGENQKNKIDDEIFKPAWQTRNCDGLWYYASNYGRVILTEKNAKEIKIENLEKFNWLKIKNGYLTNEGLQKSHNVALYTDVYVFVAEAFREEFSKEYTELERNFPDERLELHHINNNPNDNRVDNLIYLPRSIHAYAHKTNI